MIMHEEVVARRMHEDVSFLSHGLSEGFPARVSGIDAALLLLQLLLSF